ncbi:GPI mannosyltransferase 2 [Trametes maxima]|nr:GPI mannosyltransferase 2 [Trametes maxima]
MRYPGAMPFRPQSQSTRDTPQARVSSHKHRTLLLQASCLATALTLVLSVVASKLPLFDSSPNVLLPPPSRFSIRHTLASALLRWDAFHFAHIAREGYVYEYEWAFFPGAAYIMKAWAQLAQLLRPGSQRAGRLFDWDDLLSGGLVSTIVHVASAQVLYQLTLIHFRSRPLALLTSLLSLLPSSPVTLRIAGYSEPLFTLFSYCGMLFCARKNWFFAACCFALAGAFRSIGIFLCGFIAWGLVIDPILTHRKVQVDRVLYAAALCSLTLAFSVSHHYRAYQLFCTGTPTPAPWCNAFPPSIYTYVQAKYWNGGLLRYWTLQQLPNFLLGAPPLLLLFAFALRYVRRALAPRLAISALGPVSTTATTTLNDRHPSPFLSSSIAPHVIHALILSLLLLFASHTQIVLRQAASMPVTYWAAAWLCVERPVFGRWWVGWSVVWGALSCVLWAVFLPPA